MFELPEESERGEKEFARVKRGLVVEKVRRILRVYTSDV